MQARIFKSLCSKLSNCDADWISLIRKRAFLFNNYPAAGLRPDYLFSESDLKELSQVLLTVLPGPRLMVIKTLVNSWSTSRRMHESVIHPCLFCGDGEDDLAHYLICDVLWTVISTSANLNFWQILIPPLKECALSTPPRVIAF